MSNTFLTTNEIAMESLMRLQNNLVFGGLVHTDFSNEFANKGDTVNVRKPATFVAKDFTTETETQNISESSIPVKLDSISDVSVEVTSKQLSLNISDFGNQVVEGAMQALAQKIDEKIAGLYTDIPYFIGTSGTTPAALSDIANVGKVLNNNKTPLGMRRLVLDPEAQAKLVVLDAIAGADKSGSTDALREANMGRVLGFDTFMNQNICTHVAGDYAALADVKAAGTGGASTVTLTSTAGASTGKLNKGDLLTINGIQYVVTAQTAAAVDGVVTASIYPALKATVTTATVVFPDVTAKGHVASLGFHRNAFALVNRPMALPIGGASGYVANYNGLSIRVTMGYDMSSKSNTISFDMLFGVKTLQPELACRLIG